MTQYNPATFDRPTPTRTLALYLSASCLIGALLSSSAFAEDHDRNSLQHDRPGRDQPMRRTHREERGHGDMHRDYRAPYSYAQPVYVPPPVYYEPPRSPGISLFFPLDLR